MVALKECDLKDTAHDPYKVQKHCILFRWDAWVAQLDEHPALDLGSGDDRKVHDQALCQAVR